MDSSQSFILRRGPRLGEPRGRALKVLVVLEPPFEGHEGLDGPGVQEGVPVQVVAAVRIEHSSQFISIWKQVCNLKSATLVLPYLVPSAFGSRFATSSQHSEAG